MRSDAEDVARESERRLRLAIEAGRMAVWDYDVETGALTGTDDLNRLLGFPAGHALDLEAVRSRYYPGDNDRVRDESAAFLSRGERFIQAEYRYFWPDGSMRWHLMRAEVAMSADGAPSKVLGIVIDITDRKRAEEALQERERELRAALDAASLGTFKFDHTAQIFSSSARLNEIYGYPPDQNLSLDDLRARYYPQDLERIKQLFSGAEDPSQHYFEMEFRLLLPDGAVRWVHGRGEYIRAPDGQPLSARGIVMDITQRKQWEEHQRLLLDELNHRVKNTLATVQSIASQSFRAGDDPVAAKEAFTSRLVALAQAHDILTRKNWEGADLSEVVAVAIRPFQRREKERFRVGGVPVRLSPKAALSFALGLHELATNAVKYGALAQEGGCVHIDWQLAPALDQSDRIRLVWRERGGPTVGVPTREGFGTRLLSRGLAAELDGEVEISYNRDGVICRIEGCAGLSA